MVKTLASEAKEQSEIPTRVLNCANFELFVTSSSIETLFKAVSSLLLKTSVHGFSRRMK